MKLASRFLVVPGWAAVRGTEALVWQGPEAVLRGFGASSAEALVYRPLGWNSRASLSWWPPTWWAEILHGAHLRAESLGVQGVLLPHAPGDYPPLAEWLPPVGSGPRTGERRIQAAALVRLLGTGTELDPEVTLSPIPDPALLPLTEVLGTLLCWIRQDGKEPPPRPPLVG
ncbi:MAG: hypothetical protein EA421_05390 [Gemmatimonadales bacterium]|nr:MAG: hypothetical protein EA421_05390 [Gemmatimonadales bacterium]